MNRENKRKQFEKGYYKTHGCSDSFTCKVCGRLVVPTGAGSNHRNHCPNCLSSLHLDIEPGDREADCGGIMEPVGVWVRKNGEWALIHRCRRCGHLDVYKRQQKGWQYGEKEKPRDDVLDQGAVLEICRGDDGQTAILLCL